VGSEGFEEGIVEIMQRARERFLRPGGSLVPETMALRGAPVAPFDAARLSPPILADTSFTTLSRHVPRAIPAGPLHTLAPSRELMRVDLRTATAVGGIAVWVDIGLAPGIRLQTRPCPSWVSMFLPIERLPRGPGRLSLELDWNPTRRRWHVEFVGDGGARCTSEHSPLFAWGVVKPALRKGRARPTGSRR
jgi:hypothetical protein